MPPLESPVAYTRLRIDVDHRGQVVQQPFGEAHVVGQSLPSLVAGIEKPDGALAAAIGITTTKPALSALPLRPESSAMIRPSVNAP